MAWRARWNGLITTWSPFGPHRMITIADALAVGLAHHRARRFDRAELIYRHVLTTDPDQPDALHLLGLLRHEAGKHDAALALIKQAVSIEPGKSTYHANLGFLRYVGGDLTAAASSLRRALALDPETPEAWSN
ncbi:MAG: tetratricopeptide repeat protein, partial [Alphaproteobacteria bacterium]|nr:tetratricopeptide repeat protein [Alphaproteobacteria bacterium]